MKNLLSNIREQYSVYKAKRMLNKLSVNYKLPGSDVYHTPDAPEVEAREFHLVLIYDEMMLHRPEHSKIEYYVQEHAGRGTTRANVEAWIHEPTNKVLAFPAFHKQIKPVWMDQNGANPAPIKGDLFKIRSDALFILDKLMENTVWYNRFEVNTVSWLRKNYYSHLHSRTHTTQENPQYRKAWIYLANPQKANLISSYDGWRPLPMWPPRKREKGSCVYFHSYRGESSAA